MEQGAGKKDGGECPIISLDLAAAEERFDLEPADKSTPDAIFEKQWALALFYTTPWRNNHRRHLFPPVTCLVRSAVGGTFDLPPRMT